jgi:hypothetical protein
MRRWMPLLFGSLLAFSSTGWTQDEPAANPYSKNYVSRMPAPKVATAGPVKVFRGQDKVEDYQRLLEDGYDLLGYSSFEASDVAPEKLTEQAERVHADVALVYTVRSGQTPASVKLDQARSRQKQNSGQSSEEAKPADNKFYNYFASFWTKLPTPLLGVHVKQDQDEGLPEQGLEIIAVIKGSPASSAGLQKGDTLLRLGEVELSKPELLPQAAQRYAGQSVEVVFSRIGQEQRQTVTLNSRQ